MMTYVLGLDLSLTRSAAVLVPVGARDFAGVRALSVGATLRADATETARDARCYRIACALSAFAAGVPIAGAFVESYAFGMANRAHHLGELRGVVRRRLLEHKGVGLTPVHASQARALYFARPLKKPPGARTDWLKNYILGSTREAGASFANHDEADAFMIANFGLSEVGAAAFTLAEPQLVEPTKRKAPRLASTIARKTRG